MTRTIRLRDEADRDLTTAATWYEQQRTGLGHTFLAEALRAFELLAEHPFKHPVLYRGTRRALMPRFPFAIHFCIQQSEIVVVAVIHGRRHPKRWRSRVSDR